MQIEITTKPQFCFLCHNSTVGCICMQGALVVPDEVWTKVETLQEEIQEANTRIITLETERDDLIWEVKDLRSEIRDLQYALGDKEDRLWHAGLDS